MCVSQNFLEVQCWINITSNFHAKALLQNPFSTIQKYPCHHEHKNKQEYMNNRCCHIFEIIMRDINYSNTIVIELIWYSEKSVSLWHILNWQHWLSGHIPSTIPKSYDSHRKSLSWYRAIYNVQQIMQEYRIVEELTDFKLFVCEVL